MTARGASMEPSGVDEMWRRADQWRDNRQSMIEALTHAFC